MAVVNLWAGATTDDGFRVRGKVTGASVRLKVSLASDLSSPTWFGPVTPDASTGVATVAATGLAPDTEYHYAFEVDSTVDLAFQGRIRTYPTEGSAASFTFAMGTCSGGAGTTTYWPPDSGNTMVSNGVVWTAVKNQDPLLFIHGGDLHYRDITTADVDLYRTAFDDVLSAPLFQDLMLDTTFAYIWDDHDYGDNNSDRTLASRTQARQAYREYAPHYPLQDPTGDAHIGQAWQVGRVLFIMPDLKSDRDVFNEADGPDKTMLGAAQKAWLYDLLATSDAATLVFVSSQVWIWDEDTVNTVDLDHWGSFEYERDELVAVLNQYGWLDRMFMVSGDAHALSADDGTSNKWGGFPVFLCAALDAAGGKKGGPYNLYDSSGRGRYGTFEVADTGGDTITVTAHMWTWDAEVFTYEFTLDATVPEPPPWTPGYARPFRPYVQYDGRQIPATVSLVLNGTVIPTH